LQLYGLQIVDLTGDITCAGTEEDPCVSYFDAVNPTAKSFYIYNYEDVYLRFSPTIKNYKLYVKYYDKWHYTNFTKETRFGNIPDNRKYSFVFPRYSTKHFKLVGYKNNPTDDVKWTVGVTDKAELDPLWKGIEEKEKKTITSVQRGLSASSKSKWFISEINDTEVHFDIEEVSYDGNEFKFTLVANKTVKELEKIPLPKKGDIVPVGAKVTLDSVKSELKFKAKDFKRNKEIKIIDFYNDFNRTTLKRNYTVLIPNKYEINLDGNITEVNRNKVILKLGENSIYVTATLGTDLKIVSNPSNDTAYTYSLDVSECTSYFGATNSSYDLTDGLVGWWSFDRCGETATWTAWDYSGNNNHGTPYGMNQGLDNGTSGCTSSGNMSRGVMFDGVNDYVEVTAEISYPVTIEVWLKDNNMSTSYTNIFRRDWATSNSWILAHYSTNSKFLFGVANSTCQHEVYTNVLNNNQWYHIVCIYNGTSLFMYQDGILVNINNNLDDACLYLDLKDITAIANNHDYNGTIDEVRIYNRALSQDEITALYNLDASKYITNYTSITDSACTFDTVSNTNNSYIFKVKETGDLISATPTYVSIEGERNNDNLVGSWDFDYTGNSAVAYDSSGEGNDGAVTGAVYSDDTHNGTGSSMYFDGVGDYVKTSTTTGMIKENGTIEMWVMWKGNGTGTNFNMFFNQKKSGESNRVYLQVDKRDQMFTVGFANDAYTSTEFIMEYNVWNYFVMTWINDTYYTYINGIANLTETKIPLSNFSDNVYIGSGQGNYYFNGSLDDVAIWNKALTPAEILEHYNNGLATHTNITSGMNTTNSDWFGHETVSVTSEYLGEQNLTRVRITNPYAMNQYDLLSFNLTSYLGWNPNLIGNRFWYDSYTGNTDNSTLKDTSDYTQWFDSCSQGNTTGQVLCMNFNELQGTIAKDSSDEGNDGTLHGMNTGIDNASSGWTTDSKYGNALDFDGVDDYVDCGASVFITDPSSFTILYWFRVSQEQTTRRMFGFGGDYNSLSYWGSSSLRWYLINSTGTVVTADLIGIGFNKWYHIAVTYDADAGSNNQIVYINGEQNVTKTQIGTIGMGGETFYIGSKSNAYFNGTIDEVRIYNRALSPEEISASYNAGKERLGIMPKQEGGVTAGSDWDVFVQNGTVSAGGAVCDYYNLSEGNLANGWNSDGSICAADLPIEIISNNKKNVVIESNLSYNINLTTRFNVTKCNIDRVYTSSGNWYKLWQNNLNCSGSAQCSQATILFKDLSSFNNTIKIIYDSLRRIR